MPRSAIATLAVLALAFVACGPISRTAATPVVGSPLTPKGPLMAEFDTNLAKWQSSGITRYGFTYERFCFCLQGPHRVVANGEEVRIDGVILGEARAPDGAPAGVNGLFEIVRRAIGGDRATITYDETTGVPIAMESDPMANAIDDELSFSVTDWTLNPGDDLVLGEITTARRAWDARGIVSYTWSLRLDCGPGCTDDGRTFDVTVKDGEIASVRSGGRIVAVDPIDPGPFSVVGLFETAAAGALVSDTRVEFDPPLGYPRLVAIHDDRPDAIRDWTVRVLSFETP